MNLSQGSIYFCAHPAAAISLPRSLIAFSAIRRESADHEQAEWKERLISKAIEKFGTIKPQGAFVPRVL